MIRYTDGSLGGPLVVAGQLLQPSFIPAKQRGHIYISSSQREAPEKSATEDARRYHERLRAYLNEHWAKVSGFVIYDDEHHYQLNLPRWRSEPAEEAPAPEKMRPRGRARLSLRETFFLTAILLLLYNLLCLPWAGRRA